MNEILIVNVLFYESQHIMNNCLSLIYINPCTIAVRECSNKPIL
ncbi:hypothetical protein VIBNISO65_340025 [Vibrio nigripulchritudo SO65]|nr:hypothetical protein VIBNIAM115_370025 [Vibrio nigripulchritudo AM115]CCN43622.1 hypothetical protein VIBNIFTn2_590031 [Vibrio nigripulchritudo FTn2]CCN65345.1 hypothetical protein VIBNIPon4_380025 [Vibrio nigripulchritudo POn4]CCN77703.1 hypothetical protein VIBNISO65_340025 [Vibrio nigripulchritudo SO65]